MAKLKKRLEELEEMQKHYNRVFDRFIKKFKGFPQIEDFLETLKDLGMNLQSQGNLMIREAMNQKEVQESVSYIS